MLYSVLKHFRMWFWWLHYYHCCSCCTFVLVAFVVDKNFAGIYCYFNMCLCIEWALAFLNITLWTCLQRITAEYCIWCANAGSVKTLVVSCFEAFMSCSIQLQYICEMIWWYIDKHMTRMEHENHKIKYEHFIIQWPSRKWHNYTINKLCGSST